MKRRLARLESANPSPDLDRLVSPAEQHDLAMKLHRCYGAPGEHEPRLEDFKPRLKREVDEEWRVEIERAYAAHDAALTPATP